MNDTNLIFQVIVGLGMIGRLWRLTREVAALSATVRMYAERLNSHDSRFGNHEDRIRDLELREAKHE